MGNQGAGFIWTMWDVKETIQQSEPKSQEVLYELCGM
mgnify:CR=1 FL=1